MRKKNVSLAIDLVDIGVAYLNLQETHNLILCTREKKKNYVKACQVEETLKRLLFICTHCQKQKRNSSQAIINS